MTTFPTPFIEQIEGRYGTIRFFSKDTGIGAALRLYGEWAENELRCFRHFIPPGATVLDVGAFIGTHALAFSRMVGPKGMVLSFEPRARSFALLEENVHANGRDNVRLYHAAVGTEPGRIQLDPMDIGDSINFGGLRGLEAEGGGIESDEAEVVTIDGLKLDRCDFIKLDIEGNEDAALRGAATTIKLLKPVIYAESNSVADAARSFAVLHGFGYTLFLHVVDAFNPRNLGHVEHNIFGYSREAGLIAIPPDRRAEIVGLTDPSWQLFELHTLDDLVYGMLQKPQYFDEVLRVSTAAEAGGTAVSSVEDQNLRASLAHVQQELDALREVLQHEVVKTLVMVSKEAAHDKAALEARDRELGESNRALKTARAELEARDRELGESNGALKTARAALEARDSELGETRYVLEAARDALSRIRKSNIFKILKPVIRGEMALRDRSRKLRRRLKSGHRTPAVQVETSREINAATAPNAPHALGAPGPVTIRVQRLTGVSPLPAASTRPLLVCVSHVSPSPPRAGNEYRLHRLLLWLESNGWDVLLLVCPLPGHALSDTQIAELGRDHPNVVVVERDGALRTQLARRDLAHLVAKLHATQVRNFTSLLKREDAAADQRLLSLTRTFCPDILLELLTAVDHDLYPSVIQVNYGFMTRSLPLLHAETLKIVDTHDVFSARASKVQRFGLVDEFAVMPDEERLLLRHADVVLAIQPDEAEELRNLGVTARVLTVGVDMPDPPTVRLVAEQPVVLLVGSDNQMNQKGLNDFLRFAWPMVLKAVPEAELHVIGSVGKCLSGHERNVRWLGHVDDLNAAYAQARLVINPAVAGTGLKIKTLEALSQLRPIVLWPSGVDGVSPELRAHCQCVRDWFQFTRTVIDTLCDPDAGNHLFRSRDTIARLLSQDHLYAEYQGLLDSRR